MKEMNGQLLAEVPLRKPSKFLPRKWMLKLLEEVHSNLVLVLALLKKKEQLSKKKSSPRGIQENILISFSSGMLMLESRHFLGVFCT